MWDQICDIVVKTLISIQPFLAKLYRNSQFCDYFNSTCFEILGLDIIIDYQLKPWLLEVNFAPSFQTDSKIDLEIKTKLIYDTLNLILLPEKSKKQFEQLKREYSQRFQAFSGGGNQQEAIKKIAQDVRDKHEEKTKGSLIKIYPSTSKSYGYFLDHSKRLWSNSTINRKDSISHTVKCHRFLVNKLELQELRILSNNSSPYFFSNPRLSLTRTKLIQKALKYEENKSNVQLKNR